MNIKNQARKRVGFLNFAIFLRRTKDDKFFDDKFSNSLTKGGKIFSYIFFSLPSGPSEENYKKETTQGGCWLLRLDLPASGELFITALGFILICYKNKQELR